MAFIDNVLKWVGIARRDVGSAGFCCRYIICVTAFSDLGENRVYIIVAGV